MKEFKEILKKKASHTSGRWKYLQKQQKLINRELK